MKTLLGFIVPLILVCLPLALQLLFTIRRLRHKTKVPIIVSFSIGFLAALFLPLLAFRIGTEAVTADWPENEPKCLTGFAVLLILNYFVNIGGSIVIAAIGAGLYKSPNTN